MRKLLLTISLTLLLPLGGCDLFGSKKSESEPPVAAAEEPSDGAGAPRWSGCATPACCAAATTASSCRRTASPGA